jgi:hypothetical protein
LTGRAAPNLNRLCSGLQVENRIEVMQNFNSQVIPRQGAAVGTSLCGRTRGRPSRQMPEHCAASLLNLAQRPAPSSGLQPRGRLSSRR